jgi:hypothetical protein
VRAIRAPVSGNGISMETSRPCGYSSDATPLKPLSRVAPRRRGSRDDELLLVGGVCDHTKRANAEPPFRTPPALTWAMRSRLRREA